MRVRCLSVHAAWMCRHSGACCRVGWPIPIEPRLRAPLRALGLDPGDSGAAPRRATGECAFFEADAGRLCAIHRRGGAGLLPSACRHFPRVILNDARGASVTLSHFCPTAAALLFNGTPLTVVEAPPGIALDGALEGLDATAVLPPLLAPGVLVDWDAYSAWEDEAVALFDTSGREPADAVRVLAEATEITATWRPPRGPLAAFARESFAIARSNVYEPGKGSWGSFVAVVNAFLAAHAFASWAAYEPRGLRAIPAAVGSALSALEQEARPHRPLTRDSLAAAIRAADLRLRHGTAARA